MSRPREVITRYRAVIRENPSDPHNPNVVVLTTLGACAEHAPVFLPASGFVENPISWYEVAGRRWGVPDSDIGKDVFLDETAALDALFTECSNALSAASAAHSAASRAFYAVRDAMKRRGAR